VERNVWSSLNHFQVGKYAEYFVMMEFTLFDFEVYSTEVDNRGVDFVIRRDGRYFRVQVKSIRDLNYVFLAKDKFPLDDDMLAAVVLFFDRKPPDHYLIPATVWKSPNELFVSRDYEGKASKPEWGLNLSQKNMPLLEPYRFDTTVKQLTQ
jgi:hypothetical protein